MTARLARRLVGATMVLVGVALALSPHAVADALGRPAHTTSQLINLRASWGGTLAGVGAFVAWLPALRPWWRAAVGLLAWSMAGIGAARLLGFALDGAPDGRQLVWITAEVLLAAGGAIALARWRR